jgi:hypothetical protein
VAKLKYRSGETIRRGDIVRYHGDSGHVEFVVNELSGDSAMDGHFREHGPGVMVSEPKRFGRVHVTNL